MQESCDDILFKEYLNSKGIIVKENFKNKLSEKNITNQIKTISKFHDKAAGFRAYGQYSIQDNLGKNIEKSKVEMKKFKRMLEGFKQQDKQNSFEKILLYNGEGILDMAKNALSISYSDKYQGIIRRSMDRCEICIGNPFFDNIFEDKNIVISKIHNCVYDFVESDGIAFFRKLRKKGYKFDLDNMINEYCTLEELDVYSREYISALMCYPHNIIRYCLRYKDKKLILDENENLNKFKKACSIDGYKMRL